MDSMVGIMLPILETNRLILRPWRAADLVPFSAMNADPRVMYYFPSTLNSQESAEVMKKMQHHFNNHGFGFFAIELSETAEFVGFTGLAIPAFSAPFMPCVEIGWRLAFAFQGRGLATEAALRTRDFAFSDLGLDSIVSFTVPANSSSVRVMEKIGMHRDPNGDFDHPRVPDRHPLKRHVLYRLSAQDWKSMTTER